MAAILYLDVDDEITSAAARIRSTDDRRVVLVVPGGSRLGTSRINFRLLAREAQTRGRRLWIVAADGATRALAASAGLPIYGSVAEYEEAMEAPVAPAEAPASAAVAVELPDEARPPTRPPRLSRPTTEPAENLEATTSIPAAEIFAARAAGTEPAVAAEAAIDAAAGAAAPSGATPWTPTPSEVAGRSGLVRAPGFGAASVPILGRRREWPVGRTTAIVIAAVLALVLTVGGAAAFVFLPSASIVVTAHPQPVAPVDLTVRADPHANEIDPQNDVIPAQRLSFPVETSDTFKVKGTRVQETRANGDVTFRNNDTSSANTVAGGSIVSTEGGIQFRVQRDVTVPKAQFFPFFSPGEASVVIVAVKKGTSGNVPANSITVIPQGKDPSLLQVNNPAPTSGGTHKESPQVEQADIDAALAKLEKQLGTKFDELLANPTDVPDGLTVFPDSKTLGEGIPTADPQTLLDQEIETFELGMTATGSVTAVDRSAVEGYARSKLNNAVDAEYQLVDGSAQVSVGQASVAGDAVVFPVTATAQEVRVLDANALLAQVKGKSVPQARAILERYGEVQISVWPGWVTAVPTIDARVSLKVEASSEAVAPSGAPQSRGSGSPRASGSPTSAP